MRASSENNRLFNRDARRRSAVVGALLSVMFGGGAAAQVNGGVGSAIESAATSAEVSDLDDPAPLVLEPFIVRPLTSADMPPGAPLANYSAPRLSAIFGRDWRPGRNDYRAIVERASLDFGLPAALIDAIMAVESRYNPAVVGMDGEVGLMQVMLPTARMLGFTGSVAELASPEVNVHYGMKYLTEAWRLAGGDICTTAMKYRAGHGEKRFSFLSVEYCQRVRSHLAANGVAVTGAVPQPTFGSSRGGAVAAHGRSLSNGGVVNFAALNARLRDMSGRSAVPSSP
jgi:soluble lytic murein transglycosylase-like protein